MYKARSCYDSIVDPFLGSDCLMKTSLVNCPTSTSQSLIPSRRTQVLFENNTRATSWFLDEVDLPETWPLLRIRSARICHCPITGPSSRSLVPVAYVVDPRHHVSRDETEILEDGCFNHLSRGPAGNVTELQVDVLFELLFCYR